MNDQWYPIITNDGSGGAIITWYDYRSDTGDIYAQRIDSSGMVQWTLEGVSICNAPNTQWSPAITSDRTGGAIIAWLDRRSSTGQHIYAQRIDKAGLVQWTTNGVAISTVSNSLYFPSIISDATGGAIITWIDYRTGYSDIYAQRINAAGMLQWLASGVPVSTAPYDQGSPTMISNGMSGAIITWTDYRSGVDLDIYAHHVDSLGVLEIGFNVNDKWNLVSVPLTVIDFSKDVLFPTAITSAFRYKGGTYMDNSTLANSVGYWLKFSSAQTVSMAGVPRTEDTISVTQGWNLIGSITLPVDATTITSDPGGIVTSDFFGYARGYYISDTIELGKGYWVKVNESGKLILSSSGTISASNRIRIVPTEELPPPPPNGEVSNLEPRTSNPKPLFP